MEWITLLNETINYIEEHLTDEIDYRQLAQIAGCSSYYYQRMFAYMAGVPLSEYIRRRKMTLAALDLQANMKIIDVAYKYGYASPTSFNRAFQGIHNIPPSRAKLKGIILKSYPPLSFKITIKGVEEMNYRIEEKKEIRIVGVSSPLSKVLEENFENVPNLWSKAVQDGTLEKLATFMNCEPLGMLGVSVCNETEDWRYYISVASTTLDITDLKEHTVSASTWAIFSGEGSNLSIQELERRIFTEWLPSSAYEYNYELGTDIEVYLNADPQNTKYEVWIPVVMK